MGIQFSGLGSGLPVNDIITQLMAIERRPLDLLKARKDRITAQSSQYTAVSSRVSGLRNALQKITDAKLGSSFDLFQAKKATSANSSAVTATVTNDATLGSFAIDVVRLATSTRATGTADLGQVSTGAALLSNVSEGAITSGNFTVFVNNQARTITVDKAVDTVQDVLDRIATEINTVTGQAANGSVTADGKLQLSYAAGTTVHFGANGDTTNFARITHLTTGTDNAPASDTFTARFGTSVLDKEGTLVGNGARLANNTIAAGTFTIGQATFTIDANTTLSGLLSQINNNSKAGVTATINTTTNRIELVSKTSGAQAITMNDNGTGFLTSVSLVNGADTLSSQTLGLNAQFKVNGGAVLESTSNTVDQTISGLTGVTLNLLNTTTSPVNVDVAQDSEPLKTALNDFITKFNTTLSFIDEQTKKDAILNGESALLRLRSQLRSTISDSESTLTTFKTLSQVGISSGPPVNNPNTSSTTPTFTLNASTLEAALASNPEEVKKLFIGDGGAVKGILGRLETLVKGAMDPEFGVFSSRSNAANAQIKAINDAIKRGQDRLESKEKLLRNQFAAMDKLMSQFQQQQSAIAGLAARMGL